MNNSKLKKKIRLHKSIFGLLLESVKLKYEEVCLEYGRQPNGKGASYYGFGPNKNDPNTLMKVVFRPRKENEFNQLTPHDADVEFSHFNPNLYDFIHSEAAKYSISPKYLYNLAREMEKKKNEYATIEADEILINILSKFLEYENFESFLELHPSISNRDKILQNKLIVLNKEEMDESTTATKYIGFYWSFLEGRRRMIEIWINHYNRSNGTYPIKVVGLHANSESYVDGISYQGSVKETSTCFYANMQEKENDRPLTLTGYTGHVPVRVMNYIFCSLSGISKFGYPFSVEVILCKLNEDQKSIPTNVVGENILGLENIDFYLHMQRRNYRIPPRIITDLPAIRARGKLATEFLQLRGTYRLWSIEYKGRLIQSKLTIGKDFSVEFETLANSDNCQRQKGLISFNTTFSKLCISAHQEFGLAVLNYVFLDIDPGRKNSFGKGIYCGIGASGNSGLVGEYLIYIKEEEAFEATYLTPNQTVDIMNKNSFARKGFDTLFNSKNINKRIGFVNRIDDFSKKVYEIINE